MMQSRKCLMSEAAVARWKRLLVSAPVPVKVIVIAPPWRKPGQRCEEERGSYIEERDALDEVAGEDDGDGERACLVAGSDAECGSCATHGPP